MSARTRDHPRRPCPYWPGWSGPVVGGLLLCLLAVPLLAGTTTGHPHARTVPTSVRLIGVSPAALETALGSGRASVSAIRAPAPTPATSSVPDPQPGQAPAPAPGASAVPSPTPTPGASAGTGLGTATGTGAGGGGSPGFFDVTGRIKAAINGWMADLVTSALNPTLRLLGRTLLATPDLVGDPRIVQLWTGSRLAANAVFGLFIVAGGALVMAKDTLQTQYTIKEVLPRLLVAIVTANVSLQLIAPMIEFANAFTIAVVGAGLDPHQAGQQLAGLLVAAITNSAFMAVLGIVTAVLAVIVVLTYILRVTVTILLIVAAPLFLMCHALPASNPVARFWWRAIGGCLLIQLGQGITLLTAMRLFFTPGGPALLGFPSTSAGLINVLVATCLLWILARIPSWVSRAVFGGGRSSVVGIVRSIVLLRGLRAIGVLPSHGGRTGPGRPAPGRAGPPRP